ncbi:MAG: hypothetical protein ACK44F_10940 [Roseococcus sp.]
MSALRQVKTNFTAGELSPEMLGRADLRAYANGAAKLRNVFIQPTGGVTRRPGLRHLATIPFPARLVPFEFNTEQTYLLVLSHGEMRVFLGDVLVATVAAPWTAAMLPQMAFTQSADTLLAVHPDMYPLSITRTGHTSWTVAPWGWTVMPTYRFGDPLVVLAPTAASGTITLIASAPVFQAGHALYPLRFRGRYGRILAVHSPTQVSWACPDTLPDLAGSADWEEAAFSPVRGWPVSVCFHQDRLVIGGSRDLPNRLWLSCSGQLFNFDKGTGLDDQGIEFGLFSDQVNAIRAVFSARHLQVFTTGGEWMVTGDPLTPSSIQLHRQTRVGSIANRQVPPVDVDGSTIFAARSGRAIHEFVYTEVQQAYQSNDLALLAGHLIRNPVSMAYDQTRRLLHVCQEDGTLATLTLFRAEQVTAWTQQTTDGQFHAVAEVEGQVYVIVWRAGTWRLERFDPTLATDAALDGTSASLRSNWTGLNHLEGREVEILADGAPRGGATVTGGAVTLSPGAYQAQFGLPFWHVIEPLPPELLTAAGARMAPLRLVRLIFRVLETKALEADLGRGLQPIPFRRFDTPVLDAAPPSFSGDVRVSALGWRRDAMQPLWRIVGKAPLPMTLLSVSTDLRTND